VLGEVKMNPRHSPEPQRAFTLVELMIAIAVLAVILTLAAPSFRDFILMQRLKGIHAQVATDMQLARTEAASRGLMVNVRVQPVNGGALSCYIIFTDNRISPLPSDRCDCTQAEGSRCTIAGTTEIRTVQVPSSQKVYLSPAGHFAFDPVTGGLLMQVIESGNPPGDAFTIVASIDGPRSLGTSIGLSGRPTVCRPALSTLPGAACP
jgi:prepilin-type N-terminal cleavage/methylation domain-containing protein